MLFTSILVPGIGGKECNKHIEYRVIGQVVENVKETKVNCTEGYCTHVSVNIYNIFTGYEWGCRSDMERMLGNLAIISPGMTKEIEKIEGTCNNLTSYTSSGAINNVDYEVYVNCFINSSTNRSRLSIANISNLIFFSIPFFIAKLFL
uniref:ZP domain-containing protein n=1 Tax=Strongyloides papillosus TaxID=174720 RepID=A0A0N5BQ97_STREA